MTDDGPRDDAGFGPVFRARTAGVRLLRQLDAADRAAGPDAGPARRVALHDALNEALDVANALSLAIAALPPDELLVELDALMARAADGDR